MTAEWRSEARARLDAAHRAWLGADDANIVYDDCEPLHEWFYERADAIQADLIRALDALDAVLAEHERRWNHATQQYECSTCMEDHFAGDEVYMAPWPCPTVRAIEGTD